MDDDKVGLLSLDDVKDKILWRALLAEFVGTFILIFIGTATVQIGQIPLMSTRSRASMIFEPGYIIRIAFAFGLCAAAVLKAICHVSDGHINPAVTAGFLCSGDISLLKATLYMLLQIMAGILASLVLNVILPPMTFENTVRSSNLEVFAGGGGGYHQGIDSQQPAHFTSFRQSEGSGYSLGLNQLGYGITAVQGLIMEIILTFMMVLLIHGLFDPGRIGEIKGSAPLAIGLAITAAHLAGIHWTSCGINPARSIGPAVIKLNFDDLWVFILGPFIGALLAGLIYRFVFKAPEAEE